jgi:very-short-patch-repair endonuclease
MNDAERYILGLAEAQHGAFSRRQALATGLSSSFVDRKIAVGEWEPLFQGAVRLAGTKETWEQRAIGGVLAAGPGAVASYRAAAALHGMPGVPRWPEVTVLRPRLVRIQGLIAHQTRLLLPGDIGEVQGIPATTAGRTIADLTLVYPKSKMGPIFNYATANRLITRAEMEGRATGRSHDDVLRQLLDERPAGARPMGSEFEAGLYEVLRKAGLPLPIAQYRVLMPDGTYIYVDFAYPDVMLVLEADSFIWHSSLKAWRRDRERNGDLVELGWSILPITLDMVTWRGTDLARRVRGALETRRAG